jgi:hypothetical protein
VIQIADYRMPFDIGDVLPALLARALTRLTTEPGSSPHLGTIFETASKPCPCRLPNTALNLTRA